jgi:L,D-transpeptidase YcbB
MMLRIWIAGALIGLPLLVSGALAQTPASPPTAPASPAPSSNPGGPSPAATSSATANPTSAPAPTTSSSPPANPASPPAPTEGLVSPFMPMPAGPPAGGSDSTPNAPPSAAAPVAAPVPAAPKPKKVAPPRETALSDDPRPTLQPDTFFATAKASERYSAIVDAGGWPTDIAAIGPGTKGPAVLKLRKRLAIEGDLPASEAGALAWDKGLTAAVKRFQARMGLRQTGIVSGATLKAINVPARERFNELASSANRLAGLNFSFADRYVVVNLPSTSVEAVENGRVVHRYVAIVGDPEHPSPEISAQIQVINLNPTWTVPT